MKPSSSSEFEKPKASVIPAVEGLILIIRGLKVVLDRDLASIYGVPTFRFNEAVKRNKKRFPEDFMFQLSEAEFEALKSQFAMSKKGRGGRRTRPYAFTEHGAVMAANVLNSDKAVEMSVFVVRAFIKMREHLLSRAELEARLAQIENVLLSHDESIRELFGQIRPLLLPPPDPPKKRIGFGVREKKKPYKTRSQPRQ